MPTRTCSQNQPHNEIVSDKADKNRKGHLMTLDDCFSVFINKSLLYYDDKMYTYKDIQATGGHCAQDIQEPDEKNPGKKIVIAQEAEIQIFLSGNTPGDLTLVIKTVYLPATGYWSISNITATDPNSQKEIWLTGDYLNAPANFSYSCGSLVLHRHPSSVLDTEQNAFSPHLRKIVFKDFQIQPFKGALFNESFGCESWFSIGTFAGLIVLILFTMILALGIMYMVRNFV